LCNFDDVIEDGAPTGSRDPEYARGFRYGQEYGIEVGIDAGMTAERLRIVKMLEPFRKWCSDPRCDCLTPQIIIEKIKGQQ
jgi:hypothetical protein